MLLKDRATFFVRQNSDSDPYGVVFRRFELRDVMVFEKRSVSWDGTVGGDCGDGGRCVIYFFPERSKAFKGRRGGKTGDFPELRPGDLCVVGACREKFDPLTDETGLCRRIVSVEKRTCGSENIHHIVIEAI